MLQILESSYTLSQFMAVNQHNESNTLSKHLKYNWTFFSIFREHSFPKNPLTESTIRTNFKLCLQMIRTMYISKVWDRYYPTKTRLCKNTPVSNQNYQKYCRNISLKASYSNFKFFLCFNFFWLILLRCLKDELEFLKVKRNKMFI